MYISNNIYTSFCNNLSFAEGEVAALRFCFKYTPHALHRCVGRKNKVLSGFTGKSLYTPAGMQVPYAFNRPKHNDKICRFVNILMKNGKKTRAIYILEVSAFLFMQTIIKIKMPKHAAYKTFTPYSWSDATIQTQGERSNLAALSKKTGTKISCKKDLHNTNRSNATPQDPTAKFFLKPDLYSAFLLNNKTEKKRQNNYIFFLNFFLEFCLNKGYIKKNTFFEKQYFFAQQKQTPPLEVYLQNSLYKNIYSIFPLTLFFSVFGDFFFFKVLYFIKYKTLKKKNIYVQKPYFFTPSTQQLPYFTKNKLSFLQHLYGASHYRTLLKKTSFLQYHAAYRKDTVNVDRYKTQNTWYGNICGVYRSWDKLTNAQKNTLIFSLYTAISNVKPPLECRNKRFGGSNRQIPATVSEHRQLGYAIRWIIENAKKESSLKTTSKISGYDKNIDKNTPMFESEASSYRQKNYKFKNRKIPLFCFFLADALQKSYFKRGSAIQKRNLWIEIANANKAYLGFRWW